MPLLHFELKTALSPQDIQQRLQSLTHAPAWREVVKAGVPFRGHVERHHFRLREVTQLRHYLCPFLLGTVTREGGATTVRVRTRPSWGSWFCFALLLGAVATERDPRLLALGALVGLALVYVFTIVTRHSAEALLTRTLASELHL